MRSWSGTRRRTAPRWMRRWLLYSGLPVVGALVWTPRTAMPQDVASLQGTFAWDSTAGDDVTEAIDAGTAGMGFPHRRFARRHLEAANRPYRTITIDQDEETISIATDGGEPIRAPASGAPIDWTREDGKQIRVSIAREDGVIRQMFTADDEERENVFRPSADGQRLAMAVTVRMARLRNAIRYELVYQPAQQRPRSSRSRATRSASRGGADRGSRPRPGGTAGGSGSSAGSTAAERSLTSSSRSPTETASS